MNNPWKHSFRHFSAHCNYEKYSEKKGQFVKKNYTQLIQIVDGHNIFFKGRTYTLLITKNIAASNNALIGHLIFLMKYFQKLDYDENMHHGHKNTNFSAMNKGIFMKIYTWAHKMYIYYHVNFRDDPWMHRGIRATNLRRCEYAYFPSLRRLGKKRKNHVLGKINQKWIIL